MAAFFAYIATTAYAEVDNSKATRLESQWAQVALTHLLSFEQSQHGIRALQTYRQDILGKLNNTEQAIWCRFNAIVTQEAIPTDIPPQHTSHMTTSTTAMVSPIATMVKLVQNGCPLQFMCPNRFESHQTP